MLDFLSKSVKKIFGSKYDRDVAVYGPRVEVINEHFVAYATLSHDQLRGKTAEFRERIAAATAEVDQRIADLRTAADGERDLHRKEDMFKEVDDQIKVRNGRIEEALAELLPEAFAVVKETARRFQEHDELRVTPTATTENRLAASGATAGSRARRRFGRVRGSPAAARSRGTCSTTTSS